MSLLKVINKIFYWFYSWILKQGLSECGNSFYTIFPLRIWGSENIKIGDNFRSMGHSYLYGNDGYIKVGDNVSINTNVQIGSSGGRIFIGDNVLIGPNVVIRAADHGTNKNSLINSQLHKGGTINIENDVWIAANSVILKNVKLGKGCVVAAGSVVLEDVEPYIIVGGIPAKKIGYRK